jgi:Mg2+-importing ATPase
VRVKILTGDNEVITRKICREVGIDPGDIVFGAKLDQLDDKSSPHSPIRRPSLPS